VAFVTISVNVAYHRRTVALWADVRWRGMYVELLRTAIERYAQRSGDIIYLTSADLIRITGSKGPAAARNAFDAFLEKAEQAAIDGDPIVRLMHDGDEIDLKSARKRSVSTRVKLRNFSKRQGFASLYPIPRPRPEEGAAPDDAPMRQAALPLPSGIAVGAAAPSAHSRALDLAKLIDPAHADAVPETFPNDLPVRWYQERWATARAALLYHAPDLRIEHPDGSVDDLPSLLTVVGWLLMKWPSICDFAERRHAGKQGKPAYRATASAWWARMVDGIARGDERNRRELVSGAARAIELCRPDVVLRAMEAEQRERRKALGGSES